MLGGNVDRIRKFPANLDSSEMSAVVSASLACYSFAAYVVLVGGAQRPAFAGKSDGHETADHLAPVVLKNNAARGPYCGVQSLYACLTAIGMTTDPARYVSNEFISSVYGSSAAELVKCAESHGATAEVFTHITHSELARCETPMILHMRSNRGGAKYEHWAAFLGFDGNRIRLYDPPGSIRLLPVAAVLANWDGTAVAVSTSPIPSSMLLSARIDALLAVLLFLGLVVLLAQVAQARAQRSVTTGKGVAVVLGLSLVTSVAFHAFSEIGFFQNSFAVAEVARRFHTLDLAEASFADLDQAMGDGETLLIDSRRRVDFEHGTLPGAINIPVDSSLAERGAGLADVSVGQSIIVFCHSSRCGYADEIAQFLLFNGYQDVRIFRDGYVAWRDRRKQSHPPVEGGASTAPVRFNARDRRADQGARRDVGLPAGIQ